MITPGKVTGDRERVLASIRQASQQAAAEAGAHTIAPPDRAEYAAVLPRVAEDWFSKLEVFTQRCAGLRATLMVIDDAPAMAAAVRNIFSADQVKRIGYQRHPLISPIIETSGIDSVCVDGGYDRLALERCEVGVSGCFALIAQTGSVMVTSESTGGRTLSVLPPHHIVLATADQLLNDLPTAFAKFAAHSKTHPTSMISLISGPSRTGDIERILVLGAHGPKRLTIILQR